MINSYLHKFQVRVIFTQQQSVKDLLKKKSTKPTKPLGTHYVYALPCTQCQQIYIGQTSRGTKRLGEHQLDVKNKKTSSAPFQHTQQTGHSIDFFHFTPIIHELKYFSRVNLETFFIQANKDRIRTCKNQNILAYRIGLPSSRTVYHNSPLGKKNSSCPN